MPIFIIYPDLFIGTTFIECVSFNIYQLCKGHLCVLSCVYSIPVLCLQLFPELRYILINNNNNNNNIYLKSNIHKSSIDYKYIMTMTMTMTMK